MDRRQATTLVGYALGLLGWWWDDLEHLGTLELGVGAAPAHLLMYASALFVLTALAPRERGGWLALRGLGVLLVLAGIIVDVTWHAAVTAGGSEAGANMLLMPGHTIQLAGWIVGLALAVATPVLPAGSAAAGNPQAG